MSKQHCRMLQVEDSFDKVERCFDIVDGVDGALRVVGLYSDYNAISTNEPLTGRFYGR